MRDATCLTNLNNCLSEFVYLNLIPPLVVPKFAVENHIMASQF